MTITDWSNCFSEKLAELMVDRRITQNELSQESGVSAGSISAYLNKRALPGIKAILNIAFVLDVDVDELIDFGDTID